MAAPKENLLSLGHLTGRERNTFTKQTQRRLKKSVNRPMLLQADFSTHQRLRTMHLQQRWQELKERELTAQQHNRQLLQQFEEAQDTLREMLTLTAAMKTIRTEYERYLEESSPRWQQQLREKTQAAQRKQFTRMEEYLRSCLKDADERVSKSSADRPSLSQGSTTKPQKHYSQNSHLDYNQDGFPHVPYMQPSCQTHPQSQTARFPIRVPYQPQGSSHAPPSFLPPPIIPHPHPFQLHPLASTPGLHPPWPRQNPPAWASPQPAYPWSWTAGAAGIPSGTEALWGQLYTEEPPPEAQAVGEEAETSTAPSSRGERGGGSRSSHLSQELDVKPVRLSSGPAESGESSRGSSQASREGRKKREKRGRSRCTSSDRERRSSQEPSRTSSAIITAAVTVAQSSESDAPSEKSRTSTSRRTRRSGGLDVGSPRAEKVAKERTRSEGEDSGSPVEDSRSEKAGDRSPDDESESRREESGSQREEESGSVSIQIENGGGDEIEKQERSSSEESSSEENGEEETKHERDLGGGDGEEDDDDGEEKEDSQTDEEQEDRDVENDDEASERKNTTEEEEGTGAEEESEEKGDQQEKSDGLKDEDRKQGSTSSQDEEVDEDERKGGEDKMEEDGESDEEEDGAGEEEEEQRRNEAGEPEEESDSEDSIISPQSKSKKMQVIPEEASEDEEDEEEEEGSKTGSSDDDSDELSDEDDVEHLLAPQERSQTKEEKDPRADEKPKAICDKVEIFQVDRSTKTDHPSDSDEFDHFYD